MPTQPYILGGKRVPSVTTILGKFKDPGALQHWAWNIAFEVLCESNHVIEQIAEKGSASFPEINRYLASEPLGRADYRQLLSRAGTAGTIAHEMVEVWVKISDANKREDYLKAITLRSIMIRNVQADRSTCLAAFEAIKSFHSWSKTHNFRLAQTEIPLVSKRHRYGGCLDCVGKIPELSNDLILFDWKTSKGIYSDYLCQIAAYQELWNENYPLTPIKTCFLCRFDKSSGDFAVHHFKNLDTALEMFLCLRRCYELKMQLDKRV